MQHKFPINASKLEAILQILQTRNIGYSKNKGMQSSREGALQIFGQNNKCKHTKFKNPKKPSRGRPQPPHRFGPPTQTLLAKTL